jgi:deoxyribonuclease V
MHAHAWPGTIAEAREIQQRLRGQVVVRDTFSKLAWVAGLDIGIKNDGKIARAAAVALTFPDLRPSAQAIVEQEIHFPYVPGYLSFRECPSALAALAQLPSAPDMVLCDGQGIAHPRRFGIACHIGVLTELPTIGVAKSRLCGVHDEPADKRGAWTPLRDGAEVIGAVLRTRVGVKPLYVSPGHRVSLESAIDIVMRCTTKYRLPETTRAAHKLASG